MKNRHRLVSLFCNVSLVFMAIAFAFLIIGTALHYTGYWPNGPRLAECR